MKMKAELNGMAVEYKLTFGRELEDTQVEEAIFTATRKELTEEECETLSLQEYGSIEHAYFEHRASAAEWLMEASMDR